MSAKINMQIDQVTQDAERMPKVPPTLLKSRKEAPDVVRENDRQDEMITLLREIVNQTKQPAENKTRSIIQVAIAIILCIIAVATILVNAASDKKALEMKIEAQIVENGKLWQKVETQQLQIEEINKRDAVRKALEEARKK